ncbi:hypothetical protein HDU67_009114, partial [Dinochytrium kinnereticum]
MQNNNTHVSPPSSEHLSAIASLVSSSIHNSDVSSSTVDSSLNFGKVVDAASELGAGKDQSPFSFLSKVSPENVMAAMTPSEKKEDNALIVDDEKDSVTKESNNEEGQPTTSPLSFLSKVSPEDVMAAITPSEKKEDNTFIVDAVKDFVTKESNNEEGQPTTSPLSFLSKVSPENVMAAINPSEKQEDNALIVDAVKDFVTKESNNEEGQPTTSPRAFLSK